MALPVSPYSRDFSGRGDRKPAICEVYQRKDEVRRADVEFFKPDKTTLPNGGFIIHDDEFNPILGIKPTIQIIASNDIYPFAHEAGVYIPETGDVFITSNHIRENGKKRIQISRVRKTTVESEQENSSVYDVEEIDPEIPLANGAVNYDGGVLFCAQGTFTSSGGLMLMSASPPYTTTMMLSNYHGRWFNSVNDVVIHSDGSIWFTDPAYGAEQDIRPRPQLPNQIYRFDPKSGDVRAVADGFGRPNGLCFSPDEETLYITDTDGIHGGVYSPSRSACIYSYDIITRHGSHFIANKRLFAMCDTGIPDGIKCDTKGNVYSGCGDGVNVWSPGGKLIGKIYVPGGAANFCFGKKGEVFILNEHYMWRAQLNTEVRGALLGI